MGRGGTCCIAGGCGSSGTRGGGVVEMVDGRRDGVKGGNSKGGE